VRFCKHCQKSVYNLSAMTADEAETVLWTSAESPCVRFYRRADGTVVTTDRCRSGIGRAWKRLAALWSVILVACASLTGCDCAQLGICAQGKIAPPPSAQPPSNGNEKDAVPEVR
jgi:hypothetical protein